MVTTAEICTLIGETVKTETGIIGMMNGMKITTGKKNLKMIVILMKMVGEMSQGPEIANKMIVEISTKTHAKSMIGTMIGMKMTGTKKMRITSGKPIGTMKQAPTTNTGHQKKANFGFLKIMSHAGVS